MSFNESFVIVAGIFLGYWVVSKLLSRNSQPKRAYRDNDQAAKSNESPIPPHQSQPASWSSVLGVTASATVDEIRRGYKVQMGQYHPDKVSALGTELKALAERKTKEITTAYRQALRARGFDE
jgi:DnaJ-domain-containing protein 1